MARPSSEVNAVSPPADPFGFSGYVSAGAPRPSTYRAAAAAFAASRADANSTRPSPCATGIGRRLPSIPRKNIDGDSRISTVARRASNCSERLRLNAGQRLAPGISPFSCESIWHPLHTPSENVSGRAKKSANMRDSAGLNSMLRAQPLPAPRTSPYENPPQATSPAKSSSDACPACRSVMCTSTASNPASANAAAISTCPFTPCSRRIATLGLARRPRFPPFARRGCAGAASGSNVSLYVMPGSVSSSAMSYSWRAVSGLSRSACIL